MPNHAYLVTTTTRNRLPHFRHHEAARIASRTLSSAAVDAGIDLLAWVLMPDHLHLLCVLESGHTLGAGIARIKATMSREVNRACGTTGAMWARAYHDHAMRSEESLLVAARYIIANPVRAGLVQSVREYPYWNTVWLPG